MLKLLKYEWKACARTCLPLYGVLILMSFVTHLLYSIPQNSIFGVMLPAISSMLYMGVMMAAFVVTAVILIQRFYKNLLGSEGYLMFTLPVTVTQHLFSKTIIAVVMIALSGLSALISIFIFADRAFGEMLSSCRTTVRNSCLNWSCSCWLSSALRAWRCSSICALRLVIWQAVTACSCRSCGTLFFLPHCRFSCLW